MRTVRYLVATVGLLALSASIAAAQTSNATIVGDVTDPSGAAVPGVTVTATHAGTGVSREVQTNEVGAFRVYPLSPGTYEVTASTDGFKTQVRPDIVLEQGSSLKVDFALEVGAFTESVEVTGEAPMMQTQEASVGGVVNNTQIERIPVNGRNYTRLMILLPGTSDIRRSAARGTASGNELIAVNGQRGQDNNITIDGVDNNIMMQNSPAAAPPMDSIQEFRVATNNSAEFGRSAGANVNIAIKSGTNDLHGSAYWYVRNDKFDANPFFNNFDGIEKAPFKQNQFGAAVGGPIIKNKTFFFFNYEGYRRRRAETYRLTTPNAQMRDGDFVGRANIYDPMTSELDGDGNVIRQPFPGNIIPQTHINPAMAGLVDTMMPLPNNPAETRNFIRQESHRNDRNFFVVRGDHHLGDKDTFFGRYVRQRVDRFTPHANPNREAALKIDVDNVAGGWNRIVSPTSILEVKYAWNHPDNPACTDTLNVRRSEYLPAVGIKMFDLENLCNVLPAFNAQSYTNVGGGSGSAISDSNHQVLTSLSKMKGRHSMKLGGGFTYRRMRGVWASPNNGGAQFWKDLTALESDSGSGDSFATMLLGWPSSIIKGLGTPAGNFRQPALELFFQDDWRISDKLTLNFGVRYEFQPRPYELDDQLGNVLVTHDEAAEKYHAELMWAGVNPQPDPATGEVGSPPKTLGYGRSLMRSDKNNFAPRFGLAYQLNAKTVIRAGFGMFYNSTFMQETQDLRKFWPYSPQQAISPNRTLRPTLSITDEGPPFSSTQAIGGWPQNPNNRSPYSSQWNFFIQRQLMSNITVEIGYVGSSNKKQVGYTGMNNAINPEPGPVNPRRPFYDSGFSGNMDGGQNVFNSEYNALQFKLTKRFSSGLQFMANYTYANCMTDQSSLAQLQYMDMHNRRLDWSRCSNDIRHAFKAGYVYDLPFGRGRQFGNGWNAITDGILGGWSLEGLVQMQTGTSSTVRTGTDRANVGRTRERANITGDPNSLDKRDPDLMFNTAAFELQPRYTWGTSGVGVIHDDGRYVFDISVMKQFPITETHRLEFRAEFFNFPNHINLVNGRDWNIRAPEFGTTRTATTERQIQFALRYSF